MPEPEDRLDDLATSRPLSPALRTRLEDSLLAGSARELGQSQDAELTDALWLQELLSDLTAARPVPASVRAAFVRRRRWTAVVGAAAAFVAAAVVAATTLLPGQPTARTTAVGPAATADPIPRPGAFLLRDPGAARHSDAVKAVTNGDQLSVRGRAAAGLAGVTSIMPSSGPARGGTWVTLSGYGFTPRTTVTFGGVPASRVEVRSATVVRALSPRHLSGAAEVSVDAANAGPFVYF
jgi:hypothetical protein